MSQVLEPRTYRREECAVFRKTNEAYGGLSNMAPGFPVRINGVFILTVEALYQACRFPHMPEVQRLILDQHSPMTAKMVGKPYRDNSRPDWDRVRVRIMRWCLRLKLLMHSLTFRDLLLSTGDRPIVEDSRKDDFWGALRVDSKTLVGRNVLGRLLMELREEIRNGAELRILEPPAISSFLLFGQAIGSLDFRTDKGIHHSEMMDKDRVVPKGSSKPLFPEFIPESKGENSFLTKPQLDGSQRFHLLRGAQPYPEYKDSGLPWLGKIPSHWNVKRAKSIFQRLDIRSKTGKEELLTVSSARGIVPRKTANVTMFKAESYLGYKLCWPGDLVINSLWAWAGGLGVSKHHGIISSAYGVYRIREDAPMIPAFVHEVTRSSSFNWELKVRSKGVWISRLQLTDISFLDAPIHIPPVDEQDAIVRFLEWANGRLERAIRAKRKVIALLNEQKQAIIHRAVTRGLDPFVPLKPSGISWLGDIPQHWEMPLFGRLLKGIEQGWSPVSAEGEISSDQWTVLALSSVRRGTFNPTAIKPISRSATIPSGIEIRDGDVLLTRSNTRDRVGDVCIVRNSRNKTILCDLIYRLQIWDDNIDPEFLVYQLLSRVGRAQIEQDARGSSGTMPKISQRHIKTWRILLPSTDEQRSIVRQIDTDCAPVCIAIARLEREIDLLREYRTRLVADVVTGKLDVREAAAKLPVEEQAEGAEEEITDEADEMMEDERSEAVG